MRYRPSQARYTGGGQVNYLVYRSPQPLRTVHVQDRTRVRRLYFPASTTTITVEGPQTLTMRTGRQVYGVAVHYRHQLRGTIVLREQTTYPLPPRWAERTKVVVLPQGAKELALTDHLRRFEGNSHHAQTECHHLSGRCGGSTPLWVRAAVT